MTDPKYVNYIKENIGKYGLEDLKRALAAANVPPDQIEAAVTEATKPPPPPPAPPFSAAPPPPAVTQPAAVEKTDLEKASAHGQQDRNEGSSGYSHPESPVRHSYPLSVTDDGLAAAVGLCLKTLPFMLTRLGILVGFTVVSIIWFIVVLFSGAFLGKFIGNWVGVIVFFVGWGLPATLFIWLRKYVLYMLKAAHIAVLTRLITHGTLDGGEDQISYGKKMVADNFAQTNVLFVLDSLIDGVVSKFMSTVNWLMNLLPIPGLAGVMKIVNQVIKNATTYIDESIFSYNLARGDENKWRSSRDGLVYYAQNWQPVMKTAVYVWVLEYVFSFVVFLAFVIPLGIISKLMPSVGGWFVIFAILLALNVKSAFFHPLALTMVALTFHKSARGQAINPEADRNLSSVSSKFVELSEKARTWNRGGQAPSSANT